MKILVVNPSSILLNNPRIKESREMSLYPCFNAAEALEILARFKIDLVVAFLKLPENHVYSILKMIFSKYPGKKVVGLTDSKLSEFIKFLDYVDLTPVDTSEAGIPYIS